ncbi:MAG: hypothetical protein PHY02_00570 [Phycisphaerae bacterium]|nr:hypothetical protein [Phycisphaerae bacterium]
MADLLRNVVNWFTDAEKNLYDFLEFVPYCDEHKNVWSPRLVTIFLDVCSQLDSLWLWEMEKNKIKPIKGKNPYIVDYFTHFGSDIASKWAVFWGESGKKVQPFSPWSSLTASEFTKAIWNRRKDLELEWWKAYQKVKHNRIKNQEKAKLKYVVEALCGLFLAIIRCEDCWDILWEKGCIFLDETGGLPISPFELLKEDFGRRQPNSIGCPDYNMVIESKLFSYPVGYCSKDIKKGSEWRGDASNRFKAWFYEYERE